MRIGIFAGTPSNSPYLCSSTDQQDAIGTGGQVEYFYAKQALLYGDLVYIDPLSVSVDKSLESSLYCSRQVGLVVGGPVTDYKAIDDAPNMIGQQVAAAGQLVMVLTYGIGYAIAESGIAIGQPITPGRVTAGRARGDMLVSYAYNPAGLAINAGGALIAKAVNPVQGQAAGVQTTLSAANLAQAALAGTILQNNFGGWVFYLAANGVTVSTAFMTQAATLAAVGWPVGVPSLIVLGYVILNPTAGPFIGGTTALDAANTNATYFNVVGTRPSMILSLEAQAAAGGAVRCRVG